MNRTEATRGVSKSGEGEGHGEQSGPSGFLCVYDARGCEGETGRPSGEHRPPPTRRPPGRGFTVGWSTTVTYTGCCYTVLLSEPRERKEQHDSSDQSKFCIRAVS